MSNGELITGRIVAVNTPDYVGVGVEYGPLPKPGTPVYRCVWKTSAGEDSLEPRGDPKPYKKEP